MKALVYEAPETLEYRDVPDPEQNDGEQLIRIEAVGICGSDMHAYLGHDERRPAPLILGHEAAGRISGGSLDGTRVTINPLVACKECPACRSGRDNVCSTRQIISMPPREGAFAEWVSIPERNLVAVPDDIPMEKAALAEPIACGWHAVRLGRSVLAERAATANALVIGGGAIGVGGALSLRAQGISEITVIEPNEARRDVLVDRCGLNAIAPGALPQGAEFDLVLDAVGYAQTRANASTHVRPGGVILHIGLGEATGGLDIRRMTLAEITFIGTYTYTARDFRDTAQAIFDGRLGALDWIEKRPLSAGNTAFQDIRAGRSKAPKIVLDPWG